MNNEDNAPIPEEILKRVRELEIRTRRAVKDVLAGQYSSVFRGTGIEFNEVREYAPGDDVRSIDWNVTARFGHPFVKRFVEERELTVILLLDASASGAYGSSSTWKTERAAEAAALIAATAIRNNDKVGLSIFSDHVEKYLRPQKGRKHVLRVIREALFFHPQNTGTSIASALEHISHVQKRKAVVFLISDFVDTGYEDLLAASARRHDIIACNISDDTEHELPKAGLIEFEDAETAERILIDTSNKKIRTAFEAEAKRREAARKSVFRRAGIDEIQLNATESAFGPLLAFFRRREVRR